MSLPRRHSRSGSRSSLLQILPKDGLYAHLALHFSSRVVDTSTRAGSAWALGLSFSTVLAKVMRAYERERAAAAVHPVLVGAEDDITPADRTIDADDTFWLRHGDGGGAAERYDDEKAGLEDDISTPTALEFRLEHLLATPSSTRHDRTMSGASSLARLHRGWSVDMRTDPDFDIVMSKARAAIAPDNVDQPELEPHESWEYVDIDEDHDKTGCSPSEPPSYAGAVSRKKNRVDLD
jgi:hypothetical protein